MTTIWVGSGRPRSGRLSKGDDEGEGALFLGRISFMQRRATMSSWQVDRTLDSIYMRGMSEQSDRKTTELGWDVTAICKDDLMGPSPRTYFWAA